MLTIYGVVYTATTNYEYCKDRIFLKFMLLYPLCGVRRSGCQRFASFQTYNTNQWANVRTPFY